MAKPKAVQEKQLGIYDFGPHRIEIKLREGYGGEFYMQPDDTSLPRITIGMSYADSEWHEILGVLMHEVQEMILSYMGLRYQPSPYQSPGSDRFVFAFNHKAFSEVVDRAAAGLSIAIKDMEKEFKHQIKQRRKVGV